MRVLVACEFSGRVRDAFIAKGHDALSCDFLPSESPGPHYQGDIFDILYAEHFDLMIAHPSCQFLTYAGMRYWNDPGRAEKREAAMDFFMKLQNAPIRMKCIENPRGYPCQQFRAPDQVIHPYFFGEDAMKRTCLWLTNLPKLTYAFHDNLFETRTATPSLPQPIAVQVRSKTGRLKNRFTTEMSHSSHERSRTYISIAKAMADQWG